MEKIQAAIAKARAARSGTGRPATEAEAEGGPLRLTPDSRIAETAPAGPEAASASPAPAAPGPGAAASASDAAWLALPGFNPDPRHLLHSRVLAAEAGPDALSFDVIRTRMLQQMRANGWTRVAITSPGTGCGKSMLALNLAFSLARQPEQRTVLIETDLRRPKLSRYLGLPAQQEVSRFLEGRAPFADHAVRIGANLAVATQTHVVRSPAELLHGGAVADALAGLARDYAPTVMLFDMPPMQAGDDVMAFIGHVDAVLIVAAAELTTIKQIDHCERELATQCNVMGVVLNKCRYFDTMSQYEYGY